MATTLKTLKSTLIGAGVLALGAIAPNASAAPITDFAFQTSGGFVDGTGTCNTVSCNLNFTNDDPISGDALTLSWGTGSTATQGSPAEQSNLTLTHFAGNIMTNGGWTTVDQVVHTNHVLTQAGGHMTTVDLFSRFLLTGYLDLFDTQQINFDETLNTATVAQCAGLNPLGTRCDDVFNIQPLTGSFAFLTEDKWQYTISFQFLSPDNSAEIIQVGSEYMGSQYDGYFPGANNGTFDIYTREWVSQDGTYAPGISTLWVQARIDARYVPEPGTLALLGLGLAGLGFASRRRNLAD